jgi:DNA-binding response OmpR family regulator
MKMLVIEDDPQISEFIKEGFESSGFSVDIALDGQKGSMMARTNSYDIIILDYSLPFKNGFEICTEIRGADIHTPIIFLSVQGDTQRKIDGLGRGADDYLEKPFSFEELKARVRALLRRPTKIENSTINIGKFIIDTEKQLVQKNGIAIPMNRKEYTLFEYFVRNRGQVLSRSMIMEHVWSAQSDPFSNTVETHIFNLRKKLRDGDKKDDCIRNLAGRGYTFDI